MLLLHELQSDRWRLQTLQDWRWNPLVYTRIAGDALYSLLARDFAPGAGVMNGWSPSGGQRLIRRNLHQPTIDTIDNERMIHFRQMID